MALSILGMVGESLSRVLHAVHKPFDGSYIGVQTDKGSYTAGEVVQGYVVLQNNSARQVDQVVVMVSVVERTRWDEEVARTHSSGEGENRKTWTEYTHQSHAGEVVHLRERVEVSRLSLMLSPGSYSYPFRYPLRPDLPGCARYSKTAESHDPQRKRPLETFCEVVYTVEAFVDVRGVLDRDLSSTQELIVNPAFNWSTMQPQMGQKHGQVLFCCCFPQGEVFLNAAFDRAAYMAGETAHIKASIRNDSEQDVQKMSVRLVRNITLKSSSGSRKQFSDVMCRQNYPGVARKSQAGRDMPLPLYSTNGNLLPGTRGQLVDISYTFQVGCDLTCAPDIEVHLPMVVFAPSPENYGLASLGLSAPQGMTFAFVPADPPPGGFPPHLLQQQQQQQQQQHEHYPPMQQQQQQQQQQQYPPMQQQQQQQYPPMQQQQQHYPEPATNPAYGMMPVPQPPPPYIPMPPPQMVQPIVMHNSGGM